MKLTNEQQNAVDEFLTERDVKVVAYAGAGKTSTLVAMANADENRGGLYIAFNKRIAEEADQKFPFNVRCSTAHSLAWRVISKQYEKEKMSKNPRMADAGVRQFSWASPANSREVVARTLRNFMQSDRSELTARDVPNLLNMGFVQAADDNADKAMRREVARTALEVWERMVDRRNRLPLGHDGYLKLWAMSKPTIPTDVLFMDEAQDLNPVLVGVVEKQNCQVVSVGDPHQQIYEWRGAIDALERLDGKRCRLTQSFRFGERIATEANRMLVKLGETHPLQGTEEVDWTGSYKKEEPILHVNAILCRSNGGVIRHAADAFDNEKEVFIPGGVEELKAWVQDAARLDAGLPAYPGELMGFKNWTEVKEFAQTVDGSHLAVFVRLYEDYGEKELLRILNRVLKEPDDRALTISTTHKAKGLEWDSVAISEDFMIGASENDGSRKKVPASQVRLLYVAMTRAKAQLYMPSGLLYAYESADVTGLK